METYDITFIEFPEYPEVLEIVIYYPQQSA